MRFLVALSFISLVSHGLLAQTVSTKLTPEEEKALRSPAAPSTDTLLYNRSGQFNVHFSQVQLSNWAAGGQSNFSLLTKFDQNWNLDRGRLGWDSELHLAYGLLHRPEDRVMIKTDDRIEWSTKLGYRITPTGFVTCMAHFREDISYTMRLDLFSNFLNNPENIDVYSDHVLMLKINPWLTTSISATLIYDDDITLTKRPELIDQLEVPNIGPGLQLKQVLSVGVSIQV